MLCTMPDDDVHGGEVEAAAEGPSYDTIIVPEGAQTVSVHLDYRLPIRAHWEVRLVSNAAGRLTIEGHTTDDDVAEEAIFSTTRLRLGRAALRWGTDLYGSSKTLPFDVRVTLKADGEELTHPEYRHEGSLPPWAVQYVTTMVLLEMEGTEDVEEPG